MALSQRVVCPECNTAQIVRPKDYILLRLISLNETESDRWLIQIECQNPTCPRPGKRFTIALLADARLISAKHKLTGYCHVCAYCNCLATFFADEQLVWPNFLVGQNLYLFCSQCCQLTIVVLGGKKHRILLEKVKQMPTSELKVRLQCEYCFAQISDSMIRGPICRARSLNHNGFLYYVWVLCTNKDCGAKNKVRLTPTNADDALILSAEYKLLTDFNQTVLPCSTPTCGCNMVAVRPGRPLDVSRGYATFDETTRTITCPDCKVTHRVEGRLNIAGR